VAPAETPAIARRLRRDIPFDSICFTVNLLTSLAVADRPSKFETDQQTGRNEWSCTHHLLEIARNAGLTPLVSLRISDCIGRDERIRSEAWIGNN